MKRSVAVLGPTPQFIRWSLDHVCELRKGEDTSSPDAALRQLRGVREFSIASMEGRLFENVCVHGAASSTESESALGFSESEVLEVFGGREAISNHCETCVANTNAQDQNVLWAGCYGWLTADGTSLESLIARGKTPGDTNRQFPSAGEDPLVKEIDYAIQMLNLQPLIETNFSDARPSWFSFWQAESLSVPQLLLLEKVLSAALRRYETAGDPQFVDDLLRFIDALTLAHRNSLQLNVELVPRGYSDGESWTLYAHCQRCRYSVTSARETWDICPACGLQSAPSGQHKSKVLGMRPYVNLGRMMGVDGARDFLQRYENSQVKPVTETRGESSLGDS